MPSITIVEHRGLARAWVELPAGTLTLSSIDPSPVCTASRSSPASACGIHLPVVVVESFNGHVQSEYLDQHWFKSVEEVKQTIERRTTTRNGLIGR